MTQLRGTGQQLRLYLRLYRWSFLIWPVVFGGLVLAMADSLESLYPDAVRRQEYATLNDASPVIKAINGPGHALDTPGGILVFEIGAYLLLVAAIIAALRVVRHTRGEEESGRGELTASTREGRLAALLAAHLGTVLLGGVTAAGTVAAMLAADLPVIGVLTYAGGVVAIFAVFGGLAAVVAQFTVRSALASGLTGAVIAVGYALRGVGDIDENGLSWASPFGWVQAARPFAQERWWPLALAAGVGVLLLALAVVLRLRRDEGAGLFPSRPGPAAASRWLTGISAARLRQLRGPALGWGAVVVFLGAVFGAAGEEVTRVFEAGDGFAEMLGLDEAGSRDAYFTLVIVLLALLILAFGISALSRLRHDETVGLAELELATATGRLRWAGSAFVLVLLASSIIGGLTGLAVAGAFALVSGDREEFVDLALTSLLHLPAVWVVLAVTVLVYGWLPRLMALPWALLGVCAVLGLLGGPLQLEEEVIDLSPFAHVPTLPDPGFEPVVWVMLAVTAVLGGLGLVGVRRRDL